MKTCLLIQHGNTLKRHVFESSSLLLLFSPVKSFTGIFSLYAKTASPIENKIKPSSEICFTFFGINSRPFPAPFLSKVFPNYEQKENRHLSAYKKLKLLLTLLVFNVSLLSHWNVVITYTSCFHKMLVRGLVSMVLYSSGRTDKWKEDRGKKLSNQFKGNGVWSFLLAESTIRFYRHFCAIFCSTEASGHNTFFLLLSFSVKILLIYKDQEKLDIGWEVWEKMYG